MLYLSKRDIENLGVTMSQILEALDEGLRVKGQSRVQMPPKSAIRPMPDSYLHAMPVYVEGSDVCGVKWVSAYRSNRSSGLPYINGLMILSDSHTGIPVAAMDCTRITAIRTGAMVGIAAKHLARPDSSVVGILGCGVQARQSIEALMSVLPEITLVRCYDIAPEAARQFVADMEAEFPLTGFVVCGSPAEMMQFADVVVSATPIVDNPTPSLQPGMLKEGALAVSLDYDAAWSPQAILECDKIITDDIEQFIYTKAHGGHFTSLEDGIYADLAEVVAGTKPGRENLRERIMSLNLGIAVADVVAAKLYYDRAVAHNLGTDLSL